MTRRFQASATERMLVGATLLGVLLLGLALTLLLAVAGLQRQPSGVDPVVALPLAACLGAFTAWITRLLWRRLAVLRGYRIELSDGVLAVVVPEAMTGPASPGGTARVALGELVAIEAQARILHRFFWITELEFVWARRGDGSLVPLGVRQPGNPLASGGSLDRAVREGVTALLEATGLRLDTMAPVRVGGGGTVTLDPAGLALLRRRAERSMMLVRLAAVVVPLLAALSAIMAG